MSWDASDNQYIIWQSLNKNEISAIASMNESHDEKCYAILSKLTYQFNFRAVEYYIRHNQVFYKYAAYRIKKKA